MVVEETDSESEEEKKLMEKQDKGKDQDSLTRNKLVTRTSEKINTSGSKVVLKSNRKVLVDGMKVNSSEPEHDRLQLKKVVVKVEKLSTKRIVKLLTPKYQDSCTKVRKGRRKLIVSGKDKDSEATKAGIMVRSTIGEGRIASCNLSVCKARMSLRKLPKSTKEVVMQSYKTPVKSPQQKVKTIASKSLNCQENGGFGIDSSLSDSLVVEDDSEEDEHKQTDLNKEDKTKMSFAVSSADPKCEMLTEGKKLLHSPDDRLETKKRNSLFSYFNKVCKDEVLLKPEKILVKAQIHSPPVSPSVKARGRSIPEDRREQRQRRSVPSKVSGMEDEIVVLESHIAKPDVDGRAVFMITTPEKCNVVSDLKTPLSSRGWKMRVRLRELPAQTVSDKDMGMDVV
jgi:hypothetical protein